MAVAVRRAAAVASFLSPNNNLQSAVRICIARRNEKKNQWPVRAMCIIHAGMTGIGYFFFLIESCAFFFFVQSGLFQFSQIERQRLRFFYDLLPVASRWRLISGFVRVVILSFVLLQDA